jgi:hypothetical protein
MEGGALTSSKIVSKNFLKGKKYSHPERNWSSESPEYEKVLVAYNTAFGQHVTYFPRTCPISPLRRVKYCHVLLTRRCVWINSCIY